MLKGEMVQTCHPEELFTEENAGEIKFWSCVRTRPNWEKRFARWLRANKFEFFLPSYKRRITSGGKTRVNTLLLIPGYVFVMGDHTKRRFVDSYSVVRILKPTTDLIRDELHVQLWQLWKTLQTTSPIELKGAIEPGQPIRVTSGPLQGVIGRFCKWRKRGVMLLQVDMLGTEAAFHVSDSCVAPLDE